MKTTASAKYRFSPSGLFLTCKGHKQVSVNDLCGRSFKVAMGTEEYYVINAYPADLDIPKDATVQFIDGK